MNKALSRLNRAHVHGSSSSESEHQICLVEWASETALMQTDLTKAAALKWLHAIPSGGGRGKPFRTRSGKTLPPLEAVKLKREGVKPGISDLRLDYINHDGVPGLIGEMKSAIGVLSSAQKEYQTFMRSQGFDCQVWRTWQEGAIAIVEYMDLEQYGAIWELDGDHLRRVAVG